LENQTSIFCILSDERVFSAQSPNIFNAAIRHTGINGTYVPFMVFENQLGQALQCLKVLNVAGVNITVPYKERAVAHLDILSEGANIIRAVNTITIKDGVLKGFNTNAVGFMKALEDVGYNAAGKASLVFGTGGAARAVVFMLKWLRADPIFVIGRNMEKSKALVNELGGEALSLGEIASESFTTELLVNATSVSSPDESQEMATLVEKMRISNCKWVIDLNYGRHENFWLDLAYKLGTRFMDGLPMLAHQASRSFSLWTGIQIPPAVFLSGLDAAFLIPQAEKL
jgi:shikimate dehydrogenase